MLNETDECEWVIKNKIPTSFLEDLYKVRKHFTGGNDVFCIPCYRVFDFMKIWTSHGFLKLRFFKTATQVFQKSQVF